MNKNVDIKHINLQISYPIYRKDLCQKSLRFKLSRFALGMSGDLQQRYDFFLNKGVRMTFDKLFKGFLLHQFLLKKIIIQQVIIRQIEYVLKETEGIQRKKVDSNLE